MYENMAVSMIREIETYILETETENSRFRRQNDLESIVKNQNFQVVLDFTSEKKREEDKISYILRPREITNENLAYYFPAAAEFKIADIFQKNGLIKHKNQENADSSPNRK